MHSLEELKQAFDCFADTAESSISTRPWLVVMVMHEVARNLYPNDPFLPFPSGVPATERILSVIEQGKNLLEHSRFMGSYFTQAENVMNTVANKCTDESRQREGQTQKVYGSLWDAVDIERFSMEAKSILAQRFRHVPLPLPHEGTILDMGCGSGRYSIALAQLTKAKVEGVDLGEASLNWARAMAGKMNLANLTFRVGNCLQLPYPDNSFDFVFCNGVLHHTTDMEQGIQEFHRVLKKGKQGFLYLYADGGLFWHARKRMNILMKKIPMEYTHQTLAILGMPFNRFLFADNWYVPIERHVTREYLEKVLHDAGFSTIQKIASGKDTDFDCKDLTDNEEHKMLYGDGEHRYLLTKD